MHVNYDLFKTVSEILPPLIHILLGLLGTITALLQKPEPSSRLQEIQTHRPLA